MKSRTQLARGFALTEMALVILTVALLAAILAPTVTLTHGRSKRVLCISNLKQIGIAYRIVSHEHNERFPITISEQSQVFRHFQALSNELATPKVLRCSTDTRTSAERFNILSNTNLSYFAGLDTHESMPERILSGDRNILGGTVNDAYLRLFAPGSPAAWHTNMHVRSGNIGLADGSAQQVDDKGLTAQIGSQRLQVIRLAIP